MTMRAIPSSGCQRFPFGITDGVLVSMIGALFWEYFLINQPVKLNKYIRFVFAHVNDVLSPLIAFVLFSVLHFAFLCLMRPCEIIISIPASEIGGNE